MKRDDTNNRNERTDAPEIGICVSSAFIFKDLGFFWNSEKSCVKKLFEYKYDNSASTRDEDFPEVNNRSTLKIRVLRDTSMSMIPKLNSELEFLKRKNACKKFKSLLACR